MPVPKIGFQKILRNARSATRWQQNNQFWELHPFLISKVIIAYISNEFFMIILEKNQRKKGAVFDFQPHFRSLGGVKINF